MQCSYKPGSVPRRGKHVLPQARRLPFIYSASHPAAPAFYPPLLTERHSGGQPSINVLHELAASRRHSPAITRRLVVSYTAFSPLLP